MKIGIEGQRLFRRKKHGMDLVALELIRNLQHLDKKNEYFVFVKPDEDESCLQETANFKIIKIEGNNYLYWEQVLLPRAAKKYGCELLHCTSNTAPVYCSTPLIVTLHDIIYLEGRNLLSKGFTMYQRIGNLYRRKVVPIALKNSRKIITVSGYEQEIIRNFFNWPDDGHLKVVYNGVNDYFKPIYDDQILSDVKKRYLLPDHYFFFLGNTDPKKNTMNVLKAYAGYIKRNGPTHKLVMVDYEQEALALLLDKISTPELVNQIHLTGYVVNSDLPAIYNQSDLFLYPSLRESFGIPILEAMACGIPVITSTTSSMPEVAGDAALMVDPYNPDEIAMAIEQMTSDPTLRQRLRMAGFKQASQFSWPKMAADVQEIYEEAINEQSNQ